MSGLLDQAGLTAGSGLSNGAGLYKWGNFNPFDPTDLDPFLLFDTGAGSMIGTLENPTLDLDPSNQETLDVITATRAGVATYTDPDGLIATASPDTVRVDYVDSVPMILVEPSATNLLPYSEDFSNAAWTKSNVTLTADYGIAPDGTNTSTRIEYPGTAYIQDSFVVSDYTVSAFVKGVAGEVVKFGIGANVGQGAEFTLNGEWQRIQHTGTGGAIFFSSLGGNTATDFEIWGAQVETGSVATSYIPTQNVPVTRAADDLVISGSAFSDFFNSGGDGTFYAEFITRVITEATMYVLAGHSGNQRYMYSNSVQLNLSGYDGLGGSLYSGPIQETLNRASISYDSNTKTGSLNGSADSTVAGTGDLRDSTRLSIGQAWSSSNQLNGHLKRVLYWPTHSSRL